MLRVGRAVAFLARAAPELGARQLAVVAYHPPKSTAHLKTRGGAALTDDIQKQEVAALLARLKLNINKMDLIYEALTHRSHNTASHNGRLSVLGSAVINSVVISHLYTHYPNLSDFSLRSLAKHLQGFQNLQTMAKSVGLDAAVLSKLKEDGRVDIVNANAFQALVGAVSLDKGTKVAQSLVFDLLVPTLQNVDVTEFLNLAHPRFTLNRILASESRPAFTCRIVSESGRKTHLPTFVVAVYSGDTLLAQGAGFSIRLAESEAIQNALREHFAASLKTLTPPEEGDQTVEYEVWLLPSFCISLLLYLYLYFYRAVQLVSPCAHLQSRPIDSTPASA
eukprot:m.34822 g.34822  ORF g.34822 m.34822 type:complete len:336 (-) comp5268_c0_seq1:142-1149(-)